MTAGTITLDAFLNWVRNQPAGKPISSPVRTYCEQRFSSRQVTVWPKEIRVSHRYAWAETYSTDAGLASLITQMPQQPTPEQILETAQLVETKGAA